MSAFVDESSVSISDSFSYDLAEVSNLFKANIDLDGIKNVIIKPAKANMLPNKYGGPGMILLRKIITWLDFEK